MAAPDPLPPTPLPVLDLTRVLAPERDAIDAALRAVVDSGRYVLGPQVEAFEREFAAWCGTGGVVGVGNGTDALELALRALDVSAGDRVLTVANAGGYATAAIRACGAVPQYLDVREADLLVDPAAFAAALAMRPRAAIVTHLYGRLADVEALCAAADAAGVPVVEDCAQAHGAQRGGRRAGAFGTLAAFSFYPTKNLGALGDAGAVAGDDPARLARLRALRQYGWRTRYHVGEAHGRNSRLDELQAAVLRARLPRLEAANARRRAIARRYAQEIRNPRIAVPPRGGEDDVAHLFVVRCAQRAALGRHLDARGIGWDVHYPVPDHRQAFADVDASLPVTEAAAREILTLPCHPALDEAEVARVVDACNAFHG
jgi:dTDP-4-amino-4,6-dideoxygalactose transaminase